MNALIVYATNSGGTRFAAEFLSELLINDSHNTKLIEAWEVNYGTLDEYDIVFFGTNTWFYNDKEGQPHKWYLDRKEDLLRGQLKDKSCAIFALGDSSYAQFCHSADNLQVLLNEAGADIFCDNLKIDGFYRDEKDSHAKISAWYSDLMGRFLSPKNTK